MDRKGGDYSMTSSENLPYIEQCFEKYQKSPHSVDSSWDKFFQNIDIKERAVRHTGAPVKTAIEEILDAFRTSGFRYAHFMPSIYKEPESVDVFIKSIGITPQDETQVCDTMGILPEKEAPLKEII